MQENENISTYPEEPSNPSGYEGFEKSVYYIFSLLRYMYYSKVESENKFYTKNGGTITGSVTIQGNLVVNGQSYSIDTENLKVGDYTITLAKDNEQTLTSMVGMVVPKYDGTNYGFFGWDADGYAYVGDLTNYDGSSAITLANNSSLQRIATIDTTNTVVASNGVIYVYDTTSHCFKRPTNDNKYYVIRNGAFVETELFTEQKSKNIDNALYNIGAYDTISGNTITRQSWSVNLSKFILENASNLTFRASAGGYELGNDSGIGAFNGALLGTNNLLTATSNNSNFDFVDDSGVYANQLGYKICNTWLSLPNTYTTKDSYIQYFSQNEIIVEYKLATSYTEDIIENEPILNLDSNGCKYVRQEWEKGLNLFDISSFDRTTFSTSGNTSADFRIELWNSTKTTLEYYFDPNTLTKELNGGTYWLKIGINGNAADDKIWGNKPLVISSGTYRLSYSLSTNQPNSMVVSWIMLNSGTHPYPYQEYNGAIVREKDITPVLLWENSSPSALFATQSITVKDMTPYKYIVIEFKHYKEWSDLQTMKIRYNYGGNYSSFTISSINAQSSEVLSRRCYFESSTSIKFDDCSTGGNSFNDDLIIPIAIYGTNVL